METEFGNSAQMYEYSLSGNYSLFHAYRNLEKRGKLKKYKNICFIILLCNWLKLETLKNYIFNLLIFLQKDILYNKDTCSLKARDAIHDKINKQCAGEKKNAPPKKVSI